MAERAPPKDEESAAARWSRRKQEARESDPAPLPEDLEATPVTSDGDSENRDQDEVVAALPPVDSLTADSDFTPFLDRAVPADLRRLALRKLWLSDPVFANLDGLNDYDDDFRTLGVGKLVKTAYQVGKGMVTRAEQEAEAAEQPAPADETAQAAVNPDQNNDDAPTDDEDTDRPTQA